MKHDMLVQNFQNSILSFGEISFMLFDGKYSHAVIKKPKKRLRVQDDFGVLFPIIMQIIKKLIC